MIAFPPFGAWSLKTKFALGSGALMFAFSVAFTTWTLRAVQADMRVSVTDAQRALVRTTAADLDDKIEARRDAMMTIAELLGDRAVAPSTPLETFFEARPVLQKMFDAIAVVDASGHVVYDLPHRSAASSTGTEVADRDYFKRVLAGSPLAISSPEKGPSGGAPFIVFAVPLRSADGGVGGALIASMNLTPDNFLGHLGQVSIGREGYFAVIARGAKPVFVMHHQTERIMTLAPGGGPIMERARQGQEGSVEGVNMQGIETLRTFIPLRSVSWVLLAVYPTSEAYAGVQARQREVIWVGAALFVAAWIMAWLMSGWLLLPLTRLRNELDRATSESGPPMPPASFGSAELSALALAYNAQAERRREFEDRLKASERRMRNITDNLPVLIAHVDRDERHLFLNATFKTWLDVDPVAAIGRTMAEVIPPARYANRRDKIERCLGGERVSFEDESITPHGTKTLQTVYIPDLGPDGAVNGFYTLISDVTELKEAQRQLALLVRADALTGLPNRYQFNETLPLALARWARSGLALALMFIDIDHFKQINDTFGHAAGDDVLKEFAIRLRRSVRSTDMAARLGGDEFVVVLEGLHGDAEPQLVAKKILEEINRPFDIAGHTLMVTTSVGIAFHANADASPVDVLALADAALYEAKAAGRNGYRMSMA